MRSVRFRTRHDEAGSGNTRRNRRYEHFDREQNDLEANSAEEVISEMGLVLVIMLGAVLGINMMLVALHIG
jgi:hypothetical protein